VRRRDFIKLTSCFAASWPLAAHAQQTGRIRRIGVLMAHAESDPEFHAYLAAFREGLQKLGWTEGRNIRIDSRWGALDDAEAGPGWTCFGGPGDKLGGSARTETDFGSNPGGLQTRARKTADGYCAYGTPFAGELAKAGENLQAPLAELYLLCQGTENQSSRLYTV